MSTGRPLGDDCNCLRETIFTEKVDKGSVTKEQSWSGRENQEF